MPASKSFAKIFFPIFYLGLYLLNIPLSAQQDPESPYGRIIKEIRIEGLKHTKKYIVTRELLSKAGEPLLKENLAKEYKNLNLLDIFSSINSQLSIEADGVILIYSFAETPSFIPSPGISITEENGFSGGGSLISTNLLGRDIFMSARVLFGEAKTGELWLENPWITGNHLGYKLEYYYRDRTSFLGDFHEKANEFYLRIGSHLGENGRFGGIFEALNIQSDIAGVTLSADNIDTTSRIGFYLGYDNRDAISDTRRGWWNEIVISRDIHLFKDSSNFWQTDIDIRRYYPLPYWERHSLALFSLLTLRTGTLGEEVAPWQLFGIGGTNTVRGWKYAARSGKNQFLNTIEYRITLLKPRPIALPLNIHYRLGLQLCLFGDMGIGWNKGNQFAAHNFIGGFGFGVRLLVPIVGAVRIDFGWGQKGEGIFIHLGSFEKPVMTRRRVR